MSRTLELAPPLQQVDRVFVLHRGRKLLYFGGCDYFRLSSHPAVTRALRTGLRRFGLSTSASRVTSGNHRLFEELEVRLTKFFRTESATLTSNGYLPGLIVGQALGGHVTHAFIDELAHGCLADGSKFLGCAVRKFRHRDADEVLRRLRALPRGARPLILTEGVCARDGGIAPLDQYLGALPARGLMVVDDAHGVGVLGKRGTGTLEELGIEDGRVIRLMTFSKAFGVYGGAVLGPVWLRERIVRQSHAFAGNTPLPLPLAAAALVSLKLIEQGNAMRQRLRANTTFVKSALQAAGAEVPHNWVLIITLIAGGDAGVDRVRRALQTRNIYPNFVSYPGLPEGGCFRFVISSEHRRNHLSALLEVYVPFVASGLLRPAILT